MSFERLSHCSHKSKHVEPVAGQTTNTNFNASNINMLLHRHHRRRRPQAFLPTAHRPPPHNIESSGERAEEWLLLANNVKRLPLQPLLSTNYCGSILRQRSLLLVIFVSALHQQQHRQVNHVAAIDVFHMECRQWCRPAPCLAISIYGN